MPQADSEAFLYRAEDELWPLHCEDERGIHLDDKTTPPLRHRLAAHACAEEVPLSHPALVGALSGERVTGRDAFKAGAIRGAGHAVRPPQLYWLTSFSIITIGTFSAPRAERALLSALSLPCRRGRRRK